MSIEDNMGNFSRREFLKYAGMAAAAAMSGCATAEIPKQDIAASLAAIKAEQVVYPKLPGNKIQAPENGCLVGFRKVYALSMPSENRKKWREITNKSDNIDDIARSFNEPQWDEVLSKTIGEHIGYYEQALGKKPAILVFYETPKLFLDFPANQVAEATKKGVIPYLNFLPWWEHKNSIRADLKDIVNGKYDKYLFKLAQGAAKFGEKHGGFFITTMEENNGYWYYWGQNSKFIPAWHHIWQIFEDKGANKYATWVWEVSCPGPHYGNRNVNHPDMDYPGDKFVDWIGLSAFSRKGLPSDGFIFGGLVANTYDQMRKNHPQKPIMQAEFGKSQDWGQPRWLTDAYKTIKQMPGMKAAIYYDNVTVQLGDDKTLSKKSLETLKEIFKDPYWIMAK